MVKATPKPIRPLPTTAKIFGGMLYPKDADIQLMLQDPNADMSSSYLMRDVIIANIKNWMYLHQLSNLIKQGALVKKIMEEAIRDEKAEDRREDRLASAHQQMMNQEIVLTKPQEAQCKSVEAAIMLLTINYSNQLTVEKSLMETAVEQQTQMTSFLKTSGLVFTAEAIEEGFTFEKLTCVIFDGVKGFAEHLEDFFDLDELFGPEAEPAKTVEENTQQLKNITELTIDLAKLNKNTQFKEAFKHAYQDPIRNKTANFNDICKQNKSFAADLDRRATDMLLNCCKLRRMQHLKARTMAKLDQTVQAVPKIVNGAVNVIEVTSTEVASTLHKVFRDINTDKLTADDKKPDPIIRRGPSRP